MVTQMVKSLPAVWETWVRSLGQEDPLEEEMATHSSILAWEIPWTEEPGRVQSMTSQRVRHNSVSEHAWSQNDPSKGEVDAVTPLLKILQSLQACSG